MKNIRKNTFLARTRNNILPWFLLLSTLNSAHAMPMPEILGPYSMSREASGTSWQPESTPMTGCMEMKDDWMLMSHGYANLTYDHQGGGRGDEKFFSSSMLMGMASRPLGPGTVGFRGMVSLDPAMGASGYPLLLQTGETADGRTPLIDRQHPHDFFMELAATYSSPISGNSSIFVYGGPVGEPALGPPAFMHRFSGMEIPEAPITHHWLDSTHISYSVGTLGLTWKEFKLEASEFRGREPDQYRWDIEQPKLDSYSARLSFNPTEDWALQASFGHIVSPEELQPNVNVNRTTFSESRNFRWDQNTAQVTFAWGRNGNRPGLNLDAFLLESALTIGNTHTLMARAERVSKDEFFTTGPLAGQAFPVNKISLGYLYDFPAWWKHLGVGVGGLLSEDMLPAAIQPAYGKLPISVMAWARIKLI